MEYINSLEKILDTKFTSKNLYYDFFRENQLSIIEKWWNNGQITAPMGFPNGMHVNLLKLAM